MLKKIILVVFFLFVTTQVVSAADYVIGEGDVLDIQVWGMKELATTEKIRPDGKITMPGLGEVAASGVTPESLQKILTEKLKSFVKNPIVSVSVKEATNSKVYIYGNGVKSGVYDVNRRTSLLQLLCVIADLKAADLEKSYVMRNGNKLTVNFHKLFIGGDTSEDILIQANDSIFIPLIKDKNIYVLGSVATPRSIEYRDGMTVMDAILEAGGFTKFAKQNDTVVLRVENGKEISLSVKAKDLMMQGDLSQNIKLKHGDYVVVKEGMF